MSGRGLCDWDSRCRMSVRHLLPEIGLTHNLTHTGKEVDGINGADRMESIIFPEQKGSETAEH